MTRARSKPCRMARFVELLLCFGIHIVCVGGNDIYHPCHPIPTQETVNNDGLMMSVNVTTCGDREVGNQSIWWQAVEPEEQCFGLSRPERLCSKSTTNEFTCLIGEEWDRERLLLLYPAESRKSVASVEMGNWFSMSAQAAVARIVLEELMNYRVEIVARVGTVGAYERVSRGKNKNYMSLEAWANSIYTEATRYYARGDVFKHPFVQEPAGVAYAANRSELLEVQPHGELKSKVLGIEDGPLSANLLGATGIGGIFVNGPAIERSDHSIVVEFWRGLMNPNALELFPPDGSLTCKDRLRHGSSCTEPEARFHCDSSCPSSMWGNSEACCLHGKFYPPQCIPEGVTRADILADPEWSSPNCREMLHPSNTWDVAYFEAVLVNLNLNFTINYVGSVNLGRLLKERTAAGVPTLFYWFRPDVLLTSVSASMVLLPAHSPSCGSSYSRDPLKSGIRCQQELVHLTKLISVDVRENEKDLYNFWDEFSFTNEDYGNLMALHVDGGGTNRTIDAAACAWLKTAGMDRIGRWIINTPSTSGGSSASEQVIIIAAVIPALGLVIIALLLRWRFMIYKITDCEISWQDLVFHNPPVVLHTNSEGFTTTKAKFRGQPVAVKELCADFNTSLLARTRTFHAAFNSAPPCDVEELDPEVGSIVGSVMLANLNTTYNGPPDGIEPHGNSRSVTGRQSMTGRASRGSVTDRTGRRSRGETAPGTEAFMEPRRSLQISSSRKSFVTPADGGGDSPVAQISETGHSDIFEIGDDRLQELRTQAVLGTFRHRSMKVLGKTDSIGDRAKDLSTAKSNMNVITNAATLKKEVRRIMKLQHNNLIRYYGYSKSPAARPVLVYEYLEGSLYENLHNPTVMMDKEILLTISKNVASALQYMHACKPARVHGDLVSSSILVEANYNAKVGNLLRIRQSTSQYLAPEVMMGGEPTTKSDVWSFGLLLYEIFSRKLPFEDILINDLYEDSTNDGTDTLYPILKLTPMMCNNEVVPALAEACQSADPDMRPTFEQICDQLAVVETKGLANKMEKLLEEKKLLHDILPEHVAHDLALGKKVKPEVYENITLFFSDIVGFTSISQQLEPMEVMAMLDRLYDEFDKLTKKHALFKVETIGDAYMCAANLLKAQPDHSKIMVQFAQDTIKVANNTVVHTEHPEMGFVNIRVGLHSGSVVASVVGQTNPRYCLFGDTVNTASRMESLSEANCIHMSAFTARHLHGSDVKLIPRGRIEVKGKGEMETFWLEGYEPRDKATVLQSQSRFNRLSSIQKTNPVRTMRQGRKGSITEVDMERGEAFSAGSPARSALTPSRS